MSSAASFIDTGSVPDGHTRDSFDLVPGSWPLADVPEEQPVPTPYRRSAPNSNVVRNKNSSLNYPRWDAQSSSQSHVDHRERYPPAAEGGLESKIREKTIGRTSRNHLSLFKQEQWDIQSDIQSYIDPGDWHADRAGAGPDSEESAPQSAPPRARQFAVDGGWDTQTSLRSYVDPGEPRARPNVIANATPNVSCLRQGEQVSSLQDHAAGESPNSQSSVYSYIDPGTDHFSTTKVKRWLQSSAPATQGRGRSAAAVVSSPQELAIPRLYGRNAAKVGRPIITPKVPEVQDSKPNTAMDLPKLMVRDTSRPRDQRLRSVSVASVAIPGRSIIRSKDGETAIIDADVDFAYPPRHSESTAAARATAGAPGYRKQSRAASATVPQIEPRLPLIPQPMLVPEPTIVQQASHEPILHLLEEAGEVWNPPLTAYPIPSIDSAPALRNGGTVPPGDITDFHEYGPLAPPESPVAENITPDDTSSQTVAKKPTRKSENGSGKDPAMNLTTDVAKESEIHNFVTKHDPEAEAAYDVLRCGKSEPVAPGMPTASAELHQMVSPPAPADLPLNDSDGFPMPMLSYSNNIPRGYSEAHSQPFLACELPPSSAPMAYSNYHPPTVESVSSSPRKGQPAVPISGDYTVSTTPQPTNSPVLHRSRSQSVDDGHYNEIWNGIPVRVGSVRRTK